METQQFKELKFNLSQKPNFEEYQALNHYLTHDSHYRSIIAKAFQSTELQKLAGNTPEFQKFIHTHHSLKPSDFVFFHILALSTPDFKNSHLRWDTDDLFFSHLLFNTNDKSKIIHMIEKIFEDALAHRS